MKKSITNVSHFLYALLACVLLTSCKNEVKYPIYSLATISYVPDSLKAEHREWIKESIRASNQYLTAGDYEDIDETIIQVERTASNLFEVNTIGLRKQISDSYWDDLRLKPSELSSYEKVILDSLVNAR